MRLDRVAVIGAGAWGTALAQAAAIAGRTVTLVGRDPAMMAAGARMAAAAGAEIIDLNFGCPAKEVTGVQSGSALMRDLDLAESLVAAAVDAVDLPVTVKMRLGWDDASRNAPEFAARAQKVGARAITVHGRTRCQFYKGEADWSAVAEVKREIDLPLIVNGDVVSVEDASEAMARSGADGVMVGRGAYGRPWFLAQVAQFLRTGMHLPDPPLEEQRRWIAALREAIARDDRGAVYGILADAVPDFRGKAA